MCLDLLSVWEEIDRKKVLEEQNEKPWQVIGRPSCSIETT